jgi:hypothetical protein
VIVREVARKNSSQVGFVEYDDMVETVAADSAVQAFNVRIVGSPTQYRTCAGAANKKGAVAMPAGRRLEHLDASADWTARYEDLRRQASTQQERGGRWGLALMIGRGVVAWMRAWPPAPVSVERRQIHSAAGSQLPLCLHREVALVLTDMILHRRTVSSGSWEATA